MVPAKNRERKCSTCKHYQASPLWRKGWCRNPLLYDRNTNHLVEADSLACNRTFIDYWEPLDERAAQAGESQARSTGTTGGKPRVAPSIPMDTVDASGARLSSAESTPTIGSTAPMRSRTPMFKPLSGREQPRAPLSLVDEDYDELEPPPPSDPKSTQKMTQVNRQRPGSGAVSARERIQQSRPSRGLSLPQLSGPRLWIGLGVVALLIVAVAAVLLLTRKPSTPTTGDDGKGNVIVGQNTPLVIPTPTGLGDNPPTVVKVPTSPVIVAVPTAIGIGGYAKVVNTGDGLIIRRTPAKTGERVIKVADGTKLHVIDGPETADGFTWWKVDGFNPQSPDTSGWCVQSYLAPTAAP